MKFLFTLIFCSALFMGFAQSECKPYLPGEVGSTWTLSHYSDKDKLTGSTNYEVLKKTVAGDSITFRVKATSIDDKGAEVHVAEFDAFCQGGVFKMDMTSKINGSTMSAYEDMEMTVDATDFPLPNLDEAVGTELADGTLTMQFAMNGVNTLKMVVGITDRLVTARESMTTTAGTFDCIKISQTVNTKMVFNITVTTNEWYAAGVGMVRTESFDKKGKLTGYSVLTALNAK